MTDRSDDIHRRASDARFRRAHAELRDALGALLGTRDAPAPVGDADRAAALAAEARAAHQAAEAQSWTLVRREWATDARESVVALLHAIGAAVGARPVWLVVPGREPQAVAVTADVVLDNPLGFAALGEHELVLLDQAVPGGLNVTRHAWVRGESTTYAWEVEAWGTEPWLSAATRAVREQPGA